MTDQNEPNTERGKMRAIWEKAQMRTVWIGTAIIVLIFLGYIGIRLTQHETTYSAPDLPHRAR